MRIPFDSLVLEAVVDEIAPYVGGRVQGVRQPNDFDLVLNLYAGGREGYLLLSCHPEFARAHFVTRRSTAPPQPPVFCATVRARVDTGTLKSVTQVGRDRILELEFESDHGVHRLIAEFMGKHGNLMLVDDCARVVAAQKWISPTRSTRPIQSGQPYKRPPTFEEGKINVSPFERKLFEAGQSVARPFSPILSAGHGAYPVSVARLGLEEVSRASLSIALEQHFDRAIRDSKIEATRSGLLAPLERVLLARETALADLKQAQDAGLNAGKWQRWGELVLAYGASSPPEAISLKAWDYDGTELIIRLNPELDFKANANAYFERAKKAKARLGLVQDQIQRISRDADELEAVIHRVENAERLDELEEIYAEVSARRWLTQAPTKSAREKEERPFEGHKVRELMGPGGPERALW